MGLLLALRTHAWPPKPSNLGAWNYVRFPQTINTKQTSAQPVESAGKDRPAGAESTRAPGTITKTAIIPMTPEAAEISKGLRFQTLPRIVQRGAHSTDHTTSLNQELRQQASGAMQFGAV